MIWDILGVLRVFMYASIPTYGMLVILGKIRPGRYWEWWGVTIHMGMASMWSFFSLYSGLSFSTVAYFTVAAFALFLWVPVVKDAINARRS